MALDELFDRDAAVAEDAFFAVDRGWRFVYVNHSLELLLGAEREALTADRVRAALTGYPDSAILTVPEGVQPEAFRPYPQRSDGVPVTGRAFKRQPFGPIPRGASLVVGEDGVSLVLKDGAVTIRWPDVVGYGRHEPGFCTLYGADGAMLDLHPLFFRHGAEALALVDARVPDSLRFTERGPAGDDPRRARGDRATRR